MSRMDPIDRQTQNRRQLAARFKHLLGRIAGASAAPTDAGETPERLDALTRLFGLTPFERDVLTLAVGYAFDEDLRKALGGPPSFALALARLDAPHLSAASPDGVLRRARLVELAPGPDPRHRAMSVPESVTGFLYGAAALDPSLRPYVDPLAGPPTAPSREAEAAAAALARAADGGGRAPPIIGLHGRNPRDAARFAQEISAALGLSLFALDASALPPDPADAEELAGRWARDAAMMGAALLVAVEGDAPNLAASAQRFADRVAGVVMLAGRGRAEARLRPVLHVEVPTSCPDDRREMWRAALRTAPLPEAERARLADELAERAALDRAGVEAAAADAEARSEPASLRSRLFEAAAAPGRERLGALALRVSCRARWDDLVLPAPQAGLLKALVGEARSRRTVLERWAFGQKSDRGLGVSALFSGVSGVGKTMAAEVVSGELERDLFRVDLSAVTSKYIGETEKNLERVFDAAEESGAVLLFDECDALFGRRGEVRDGRDRYANLEVSYLLQRIEAYRGVAILTSNLKDQIDDAFLRRLRFVVRFPFPDAGLRERIWRGAFPSAAPCEGLDFEKLARLQATGGQIRNIALTAAFLAADEAASIGMGHLARAAQMEFGKLDRAPAESETRGWAS